MVLGARNLNNDAVVPDAVSNKGTNYTPTLKLMSEYNWKNTSVIYRFLGWVPLKREENNDEQHRDYENE